MSLHRAYDTQGQPEIPAHISNGVQVERNAKGKVKIELKTIAIYFNSCFKI